jgi:hypothetical protein
MPFTIVNLVSDSVTLPANALSMTLQIDCRRVLHAVSRIEIQSSIHQFPTNATSMYYATSSLFQNQAFVSGAVSSQRSSCDGVNKYVFDSPTFIGALHTGDYKFTTALTSVATPAQAIFTLVFFSDPEGRYI